MSNIILLTNFKLLRPVAKSVKLPDNLQKRHLFFGKPERTVLDVFPGGFY